ncbi:MAG: hypothetical protein L0241_10930 [Planctomycetia bacterium]|nr:hypothetical protein [Planctomycetia bacterium]
MFFTRLFWILVLASFIAGFSHPQQNAMAIDPPACPQFKCRTIHAFWDVAEHIDKVDAYHVVGEMTNSNGYYINIFTDTSVETTPWVEDGKYV